MSEYPALFNAYWTFSPAELQHIIQRAIEMKQRTPQLEP